MPVLGSVLLKFRLETAEHNADFPAEIPACFVLSLATATETPV